MRDACNMASSVTEAQSFEEGIGVEECNKCSGECNGVTRQKCYRGRGRTSGHKSITAEWLHGYGVLMGT